MAPEAPPSGEGAAAAFGGRRLEVGQTFWHVSRAGELLRLVCDQIVTATYDGPFAAPIVRSGDLLFAPHECITDLATARRRHREFLAAELRGHLQSASALRARLGAARAEDAESGAAEPEPGEGADS